ncbi:MAG: hypothetical protein V7K38_12095 [Nostoc sp.]|uniref:hypothetical protein n=1 Tax=Nostoc sp. TaxID=1180 RepID=UPI002FFA19D2
MKMHLIIKRTALRVHQSPTVGNPPTALVHQVRHRVGVFFLVVWTLARSLL